ncbi:MAG: glycosyltransferase [Chloroflexota bacterium]
MRATWEWLNDNVLMLAAAGALIMTLLNALKWPADRRRAVERRSVNPPPVDFSYTPKVSALVAAWNEDRIIKQHVESFRALRYPNKELVLVAGGQDNTYNTARALAGEDVIVIEQPPGTGKQGSLRLGYPHTSGDLIFLTDADGIYTDEAFERTIAPIINDGAHVSTGASRPLPRQRSNPFVLHLWFIERYVRAAWGETTDGVLGRNAAVSREALDAIDGFDADVQTGTDYHMAKSLIGAGYLIRYAAYSEIPTTFAEDLKKYRTQQTRWLRNVVTHGLRYKAYGEVIRNLIPAFIGLFMLIAPLAALLIGPIVMVAWAAAAAHVLWSRVRYMRFGEIATGYRFGWGYLLLPVYILLDFMLWSLTLFQYTLRSLRSQW